MKFKVMILLTLFSTLGLGCSEKNNKDRPLAELDLNRNGIRDYLEPEIEKLAKGSEKIKLLMEQNARAIDGAIGHLDDPVILRKQGEALYKSSCCTLALDANKSDDTWGDELIVLMNDTYEHSKVYMAVYVQAIEVLRQHINEKDSENNQIILENCSFDVKRFLKK